MENSKIVEKGAKKEIIRSSPYEQCLEFDKVGLKPTVSKMWIERKGKSPMVVPFHWVGETEGLFRSYPTFDLAEILDILPGELKVDYPKAPPWVETFQLIITKTSADMWEIGYYSMLVEDRILRVVGPDLLIGAGELLLNAIEQNLLNVEELNKYGKS